MPYRDTPTVVSETAASAGSGTPPAALNGVTGDWDGGAGIGNLPGYCGVVLAPGAGRPVYVHRVGLQWRGAGEAEYPGPGGETGYTFAFTAPSGAPVGVDDLAAAGLLADGVYREYELPVPQLADGYRFGKFFDSGGYLDVEIAEIAFYVEDVPPPDAPALTATPGYLSCSQPVIDLEGS